MFDNIGWPELLVLARTHPQGDTVVCLARDAVSHDDAPSQGGGAEGTLELDLACLPGVRAVRERLAIGGVSAQISGTTARIRAQGPGVLLLRAER